MVEHLSVLLQENYLCWSVLEVQEGHWHLVPRVEELGLLFLTLILVYQPYCYPSAKEIVFSSLLIWLALIFSPM